MNLIDGIQDILVSYGAAWVLWLLFFLSVVSFAIVLERGLYFRKRKGDVAALAERLHLLLEKGERAEALDLLDKSEEVAASIAAAGLRLAYLGHGASEKAMKSARALEKTRLQKRLTFLGTLGNNAPFIGLFGTVIGVIQAFEHLGQEAAEAASQAASSAVMSGLSEALIATAVGIAVAIPAVVFFNYFQRRVNEVLSGSQALAMLVLAYLEAPEKNIGPLTERVAEGGLQDG